MNIFVKETDPIKKINVTFPPPITKKNKFPAAESNFQLSLASGDLSSPENGSRGFSYVPSPSDASLLLGDRLVRRLRLNWRRGGVFGGLHPGLSGRVSESDDEPVCNRFMICREVDGAHSDGNRSRLW